MKRSDRRVPGVSGSSEHKLPVAPEVFWTDFVQHQIAAIRDGAGLADSEPHVIGVESFVTVIMTGRGGSRKPGKRFNGTQIDWSFVEELMETLAPKQRSNQELQLHVLVNVKTKQVSSQASNARNLSSRLSATSGMHAERRKAIDQTGSTSGQRAAWPDTIKSVRCVKDGCPRQGQHYCQVGPAGEHVPLRHGDIRKLTKRGANSEHGTFARDSSVHAAGSSHKRQKLNIAVRSSPSVRGTTPSSCGSPMLPRSISHRSLAKLSTHEIAGALGVTEREDVRDIGRYRSWHQSEDKNDSWLEGNRKMEEIALKHNLDVIQIGFKFDLGFFVKEGAPAGTAQRWQDRALDYLKQLQYPPCSESVP